jgi:hypothetical protein
MLNCKQVTEQAEEYLNKNLTFRQKLSAQIHLLICKSCRRYVMQYEITKRVINTMLKTPRSLQDQDVALAHEDKSEKVWQKIKHAKKEV